jgi:hypothetical protein
MSNGIFGTGLVRFLLHPARNVIGNKINKIRISICKFMKITRILIVFFLFFSISIPAEINFSIKDRKERALARKRKKELKREKKKQKAKRRYVKKKYKYHIKIQSKENRKLIKKTRRKMRKEMKRRKRRFN